MTSEIKCIAQKSGDGWHAYHGDSCEVLSGLPSESIGLSVYSPPFSSLYVYSDSPRDLGNVKNDTEFFKGYKFIIEQLFRLTKPGRITAVHCMDLPSSKTNHGFIGLRDFSGAILRAHEDAGWHYHSRICVWKDPVTAMQRTKAIGLLNKQKNKDSALSRQGIPDTIIVMRKPGVNAEPIFHDNDNFPIEEWQRFASPVWASLQGTDEKGFLRCVNKRKGFFAGQTGDEQFVKETNDGCGIDQGYTLNRDGARDEKDERHICPLQLEVIERCVKLWSNPNDIVLSPFMGIGSEGFQSIKMGRKFIGCELKPSYFDQAIQNLASAKSETLDLFNSAQCEAQESEAEE